MDNLRKLIALYGALLFSSATLANCGQLFSSLEAQLHIDHTEFDQTANRGWRALAGQKCYDEAAILIGLYIEHTKTDSSSLQWHLLQMHAMAGNTPQAVKLGHEIVAKAPPSQPTFLWKEYVQATVAFLEGDNQQLLRNRNLLARHKHSKPNEMNLMALDRLIANIKKPYADAYFAQ
ncbi:hypothetical protein L1077_20575 [Pseudoalteromonas luteoviolacea]|uniref:hypothetical protein n=1 Tax=Pseudoalteromonas luteoviolacea TaxID=43657 RepID=UPI001F15F295|nr:hypothetical protein [Pseudoalteromonas luteoviolacea]MCF6441836.1 hypothetical protein [Pseudoalteromonas luteoviolacea]